MKIYFLTGATGVVGSAIAQRLLEEPDTRIKLLIRALSQTDLDARLDVLCVYWGLDAVSRRTRVEAIRGDTTVPYFGIAPERYAALSTECTHIVHCAAMVRMNLPIEEARLSAVVGAYNILDFARAARAAGTLEKVEFISTVGVGGRLPGVLPERWITEERTFHNTYEQAKAEAETVVAAALEEGLPMTVHRLSMVIGHSCTGRIINFQIFYHLAEFLSGTRSYGLFPNPGKTTLDIVPVDYVAEVVVWSSRQPGTIGSVLHLCAGPERALPLLNLRDRIGRKFRAAGFAVPPPVIIPAGIFRAAVPILRVIMPANIRRALNALPIFLEYLAEDQSFGNQASSELLNRAGICYPATTDYVDRALDYYLAHGKRAKPASSKT
ncbi:MAG TPA: SDR family oxidoreductase [Nitrospirales bacterium]|jgi:thioester reductase-like protein